jgi:DNA-binding PadR family transcriptional regulator
VALSRDLFLGFVKLHILHHASREPVYGLWLIEELAGHGYRLSPGTLYPMLRGLEETGLLASQERVVAGKVRKYYIATRKGKAALADGRVKARILLDEIGDPAS